MESKFKFSRNHLIVIVIAFAVIGVILLLRTFAATGTQRFEAEAGGLTGTADSQDEASASGGEYATVGIAPAPVDFSLSLVSFATGLDRPASIAGDTAGNVFVGELAGRIKQLSDTGSVERTILDITDVVGSGGERGLLGFVFHPDFSSNKVFFVYYTEQDGDIVVSRFKMDTANPAVADRGSEAKLLTIPHQQQTNHNGGGMFFDDDLNLYISTGDGGGNGGSSLDENAQDKNSLLGKILRIKPSNPDGGTYTSTAGNPFVGADGADEIFALGLRNPWRISRDAATENIFIADVGENAWEEINVLKPGDPEGTNFGWGCFEGLVARRTDAECAQAPANYLPPVHVYNQSGGACSVIGGYVYRGTQYPAAAGHYTYADYCSGELHTLGMKTDGTWEVTSSSEAPNGANISSFGQDFGGEQYVASVENGTVYKLHVTTE